MPSHNKNLSKSMSFTDAFLPPIKTFFGGNSNALHGRINNCKELIFNNN